MFEGRYYIRTFGCQMNEVESEAAAEVLEGLGYHRTFTADEADVLLVNTCSVRDKAEHKAYSAVGRMAQVKAANPNVKLGVMGCVPEMKTHQFGKFPAVDFMIGAKERNPKAKLLAALGAEEKDLQPVTPDGERSSSLGLTVVRGCSYYCKFCIVPYVRGHEDSIPLEEILQQVRRAVDHGVREITLLGQNVLWYGKDLQDTTFVDLLRAVCAVDGVLRVRFLTSHPNDLTEELVAFVAENDKCYKAFHLPIQSGSDKMLDMMNRRGTVTEYHGKAAMIRRYLPGAVISTDLIAGYPGETNEDHAATLALMDAVGWESAFIFAYSPRAGTPAAKRPPGEEVDTAVAKARVQDLLARQGEITLSRLQEDADTEQVVFVSKCERDGRLVGHTNNYRKVVFDGPAHWVGTVQTVKIITVKPWGYEGEALKVAV